MIFFAVPGRKAFDAIRATAGVRRKALAERSIWTVWAAREGLNPRDRVWHAIKICGWIGAGAIILVIATFTGARAAGCEESA